MAAKVAVFLSVLVAIGWGLRPPGAALSGTPVKGFVWGVGTHLINASDGVQRLRLLEQLGAQSFRDDVHWKRVEKRARKYEAPPRWDAFVHAARARGIAPLLILDYGNPLYEHGRRPTRPETIDAFAAYAAHVAKHFAQARPMYEVWNEWKMSSAEDVAQYLRLLSKTQVAVKRGDPNALVLGGGFNVAGMDALERFVAMGGLKQLDGVSVHPYVHCERHRDAEGFMSLLMRMLRVTDTEDPKPLYITEAGWPTHVGSCGISGERAAEYLASSYLIARCSPRVAGLWWYDLRDDGPDEKEREHNFGLFTFRFEPKPAAGVARRIAALNQSLSCSRAIKSSLKDAEYKLDGKTLSYDALLERLLAPAEGGGHG